MNRRAFLTSLTASTTLWICPAVMDVVLITAPEINWKNYFEQWIKDATAVHVQCWEDQVIYGTAAWRNINTYPFIERIDPTTLQLPITTGGLL